MTRYSDNIYSGNQAVTSALSSKSPVVLCKTHRFLSTSGTQTGTFPIGTQNLDAKLYINNQTVSAATAAKITVSAGGTNLIAISGIGSATGVLRGTQAGLGTMTVTASAASILTGAASSELSYSVTYVKASGDTTGDFQLQLTFNRVDSNTLGITA